MVSGWSKPIIEKKILESWATPNWSEWPVGQEEFRSQIPSPKSSIPNPRSRIPKFSMSEKKLLKFIFSEKTNLGQKKISEKKFGSKFFGSEKKFGSKFFGFEKTFGSKFSFPKKNLGRNFFFPKKNVGQIYFLSWII